MNRSDGELFLESHAYDVTTKWDLIFAIKDVLKTCDKLRHKISVLNRRLQRVRTENKRLRMENQKLIDFYFKYGDTNL